MARTCTSSYRSLLLASAAGFATFAALVGAAAQAANITVSTQQSSTTTLETLQNGDNLSVTSTGGLTITIAATGSQPAVTLGALGVGAILNSGTIDSDESGGLAINIGGTTSLGSITNDAGGTIQTTGSSGDAIFNVGTLGTITNAAGAFIQNLGQDGYAIYNNGGTIAAIANSGIIQSSGQSGAAVENYGWTGSITNSVGGVIQATGEYGNAIENSTTLVSLTNGGSILAAGTNAIAINNSYGWMGSIVNNVGGMIQAAGTNGIAVSNDYGWIGSLSNNGIIQATGNGGIAIENYGTLIGISNSGTIQATGANGIAVYSTGYEWTGTITNNLGGVIQATGTSGTAIENSTTLQGIVNSGLIQATGDGGKAIYNLANYYDWMGTITNNLGGAIQATGASGIAIQNDGTLVGIANNGLIQATGTAGIAVENNGTLGVISNSGTILSSLGTAILVGSGGTITNGITNVAGGLIQGGPANGAGIAIDNSAATAPLSITTGGTIIGAIKQGSGGDTLTVTGGAIVGDVIGQPGSNGAVNFALGSGRFATDGNVTGVDTVTVSSGLLAMAPGAGTISGAQAFNIQSGATAQVGNNVGAVLTTNSGVLDVGSNTPTLTGNYVQTATGGLAVTVNGSTIGELKVTGSAVVTPGPQTVVLHFVGAGNYANLPQTLTVLDAAGGLTFTQGATATSDAANPYYQTPILSDPVYTMTLTFAPPTQAALQAYAASLLPSGNSSYLRSAGSAYGARIASLSETSFNDMIGVLSGVSAQQALALEQQAAPRSIASAAAELANGLGANTALSLAIATRQMTMHETTQDPPGRGIQLWALPLGSTDTQSEKDGFAGFSAGTYGIALGGDSVVTPALRAGAAIAFAESDINYAGGASGNSDKVQSVQFGIYGTYQRQGFFVDAALSGGFNQFNSTQNLVVLGQQTGAYSGGQITAEAGAGYDFHVRGAVVTPGVGLRELHMGFGSYTMAGGSSPSAHIDADSLDLVQSRLGAQIAYPLAPRQGWLMTPTMHAYYLHNFNTAGVATVGTFSNGLSFDVTAPSEDANLVDVGAGVTVSRGGPLSLDLAYQYTGGASTSDNTFLLNVKAEF